jgi:serine/threonine protein kinase
MNSVTALMTSLNACRYGPLWNPDFREQSCVSIATYTKQIVNALLYLHKKQFIHRDVKPDNVLVSETNGHVKLADFGTLVDLNGLDTNSTDMAGSVAFSDRSVLLGNKYRTEVDIFSLGATVWKLVSGKNPFHADDATNQAELLEVRRTQSDAVDVDEDWPDDLRDFITSCLAKAPERLKAADLLKHPFLANASPGSSCWTDAATYQEEPTVAEQVDFEDVEEESFADAPHAEFALKAMSKLLHTQKDAIAASWAEAAYGAGLQGSKKNCSRDVFRSHNCLKPACVQSDSMPLRWPFPHIPP